MTTKPTLINRLKQKIPRVNWHSKRTRLALRFFTYGFMTLATLVISTIVLLLALGYRFNTEGRTFEQGGLIQFRSFPSSATVGIDGTNQSAKTPSKASVAAGRHTVTMELDGYKTWNKDVSIQGGQLLWLNYIRFIPENLTTEPVKAYERIHDSLVTPNKRFMVLQPAPDTPKFVLANIREETNPTFSEFTLPANTYTQREGATHNFELIEWDLGGRYLLVRHTIGDVTEVLRVDREQPKEVINLTTKYGKIGLVHFAGNDANVAFGLIGNELHRLDVDTENTTTGNVVLANGVTFFTIYRSDYIALTAVREDKQEVSVIKDNHETVVATYPVDEPIKIDLSNYFSHDYLAIASKNTVEVLRDPSEITASNAKVFARFTVDQPSVEWLKFSNNGRMIVAQHQASYTTYDLELSETYRRSFEAKQKVTEPFKWLDDYYLIVDLDDNLRIVEFDGTNERTITGSITGQAVSLSENGEALFSFGRSAVAKEPEVQRTKLVVD